MTKDFSPVVTKVKRQQTNSSKYWEKKEKKKKTQNYVHIKSTVQNELKIFLINVNYEFAINRCHWRNIKGYASERRKIILGKRSEMREYE